LLEQLIAENPFHLAVPDLTVSAIIGKSVCHIKRIQEDFSVDLKVSNVLDQVPSNETSKSMGGYAWRVVTFNSGEVK